MLLVLGSHPRPAAPWLCPWVSPSVSSPIRVANGNTYQRVVVGLNYPIYHVLAQSEPHCFAHRLGLSSHPFHLLICFAHQLLPQLHGAQMVVAKSAAS